MDVLYWSEAHHALVESKQYRSRHALVESKQYRCMYVEAPKHPCDLVIVWSEVWVKILLNEIISVSDNILNSGQYGSSSRKEKRALFLDAGVQLVKKFYFGVCKLLGTDAFVDMYKSLGQISLFCEHVKDY